MVSWSCPYCGKAMYSAWDKHTDEVVICIHSDGIFKNPYYRGKEGENASISKLHRQQPRV